MNDIVSLMKDAQALFAMSPGQKIAGSLVVTLLGMGGTFLVLLLLMFAIKLLALAGNKRETPAPQPQAHPASPEEPEEAVAAAITAILALHEGERPFTILTIRNLSAAPPSGWSGPAPERRTGKEVCLL